MLRAVSKNSLTVGAGIRNRSVKSRVKSSRVKVVVSENIGLSKRMFLSCTIESAIWGFQ